MTASFPKAVIERFDRTDTIEIETRSAKGTKHLIPIWIVVVDAVPYVRSVRGPAGRWYDGVVPQGRHRTVR